MITDGGEGGREARGETVRIVTGLVMASPVTSISKNNFEEVLSPPPPDMISKRSYQTLSFPTFSAQLADQIRNNQYDKQNNATVSHGSDFHS